MTITCISPIDGSVYAERSMLSRTDADEAVERAEGGTEILGSKAA